MVVNMLHIVHWSFQAHSPYVASLQITTAGGPIEIINIYNPRDNGPRIQVWDTVARVIDAAIGQIILLGDFNAHHPAWGGASAASEPQSNHLLIETRRRELNLLTPIGLPT